MTTNNGLLGKKLTEQHKRNIGLGNKGKIITKETIEKIKQSKLISFNAHPEIKEKMSISQRKTYENGRIPFWKGKEKSNEIRNKISETRKRLYAEGKIINARKGKIVEEESKRKMSETKKLMYKDKTKNPFFGKHHSKETKEKIALAHLGKKGSQKQKDMRLHQIFPIKDTSIEIKLQEELKKLGIHFEKHKAIIGQPDIFIEPNICIFADGCYWHGCEKCFEDRNRLGNRQRYAIVKDNIITQKLINDGYIVLRFWEHEINDNMENLIIQIKSIIKKEVIL